MQQLGNFSSAIPSSLPKEKYFLLAPAHQLSSCAAKPQLLLAELARNKYLPCHTNTDRANFSIASVQSCFHPNQSFSASHVDRFYPIGEVTFPCAGSSPNILGHQW
jgi:hypothetical protein